MIAFRTSLSWVPACPRNGKEPGALGIQAPFKCLAGRIRDSCARWLFQGQGSSPDRFPYCNTSKDCAPFLQRGLSYMRELPPKSSNSLRERIGGMMTAAVGYPEIAILYSIDATRIPTGHGMVNRFTTAQSTVATRR